MEIAVLGGGNGCYAAAAHLADSGHNVRFWRRDRKSLASLIDRRAIALTDWHGTRDVLLNLVTNELAKAIDNAEIIVIPLPCTSHRDLACHLTPLLQDHQTVYLPPGTFGSWIFAQAQQAAGNTATVAYAETGTLPYLARMQGPDHVRISVYATRLPTGVFPATDTDRALEILADAYPVEPLKDALDGALMNAGPIIHPPLIMMNAGPLEHFDAWDIHNEGTQPSIRRVTDALDGERIAVREAFGYGAPHFPLADHYDDERDEWMYGNSSHNRLTGSGDWREKIDLKMHRYMQEDTILGLSLLTSLAARKGVAMPIASGFLAIAAAITDTDLSLCERHIDNLGLAEIGDAAFSAILQSGFDR